MRPLAWSALAAAILLTVSLLGWRQLHQTNRSPPNSSISTSPPSPAERPRRSSPPAATPSNRGFRDVSPSASTYLTPQPCHATLPSKAQTSPTSTANPPPCSSSRSTNTRSQSFSPNELADPSSLRSNTRSEFTINSATTNDLRLVAVSDVNPADLNALVVALIQAQSP
jgi:hypothetical protein